MRGPCTCRRLLVCWLTIWGIYLLLAGKPAWDEALAGGAAAAIATAGAGISARAAGLAFTPLIGWLGQFYRLLPVHGWHPFGPHSPDSAGSHSILTHATARAARIRLMGGWKNWEHVSKEQP